MGEFVVRSLKRDSDAYIVASGQPVYAVFGLFDNDGDAVQGNEKTMWQSISVKMVNETGGSNSGQIGLPEEPVKDKSIRWFARQMQGQSGATLDLGLSAWASLLLVGKLAKLPSFSSAKKTFDKMVDWYEDEAERESAFAKAMEDKFEIYVRSASVEYEFVTSDMVSVLIVDRCSGDFVFIAEGSVPMVVGDNGASNPDNAGRTEGYRRIIVTGTTKVVDGQTTLNTIQTNAEVVSDDNITGLGGLLD